MTNKDVIEALQSIRTYCSADCLEKLDYAIEVIQKLDREGIENPLETDFSKINKEGK